MPEQPGRKNTMIVWFRRDLRLHDNPALHHAAGAGDIIPVYIHDDTGTDAWAPGAAGKVWLHHSLKALNESLRGRMVFLKGDAADLLPHMAKACGASGVVWNRRYEPAQRRLEKQVEDRLADAAIGYRSFQGNLLIEPWKNGKDDGTPYKVFTPFKNRHYLHGDMEPPLPPPSLSFGGTATDASLQSFGLLPAAPRWDEKIARHWDIGEAGALARLERFLDEALPDYAEGRDRPDREHISRLSPHLHFGEISVRALWHAVARRMAADGCEPSGMKYLSELAWREFSAHLLHHFPDFPDKPFQPHFAGFQWEANAARLEQWQTGMTGYPIVDAGMRELWETGFMHNRVRMVAASFLVKDLLIPWQAGERWFWDCLFDADLANNSGNWQWVAGCGADAAPYYRVFNPSGQGQKFDPDGTYVRRWVPELARMPAKYIHMPWTAPKNILDDAGVVLGQNYPEPVVDHDAARLAALERFKKLKAA